MNVMMLQASCNSEITIEIDGEDAEPAMTAIVDLINSKFDEAE